LTLVNTTLVPRDRHYITQMFRKFGISYERVRVDGHKRKVNKIDINDIKKMIDIYSERLANNYNANYIVTRRRWIKIYNELKGIK